MFFIKFQCKMCTFEAGRVTISSGISEFVLSWPPANLIIVLRQGVSKEQTRKNGITQEWYKNGILIPFLELPNFDWIVGYFVYFLFTKIE